jgi:hypothetical protein
MTVSASSFTDWSVMCDYPECASTVFVSDIDSVKDVRGLRKLLKKRGWTVAVPVADMPSYRWATRPLDFCPNHKAKAA